MNLVTITTKRVITVKKTASVTQVVVGVQGHDFSSRIIRISI